MTHIQFNKLPLGVYRIYWEDGSTSVAAIGQDRGGKRWIAPTNWLSVGSISDFSLEMIVKIELITTS